MLYHVDAFADGPFTGNPAAVCMLEKPADAHWMQSVAAEMNLSETAFVVARGDGGYDLRWFTPGAEVELCGHATLASAHALWENKLAEAGRPIAFHTRWRGVLRCEMVDDGRIAMDFPADPPEPAAAPAGLIESLGLGAARVIHTARSRYDYLVEVEDEAAVRGAEVDFAALGRIPDTRGVLLTSAAGPGADDDVVSRFFAPSVRVNEDPVTGSAHCVLAPYWCGKLGRATLACYQASARGGRVGATLRGERVTLTGKAVTIAAGRLMV